MPGTTIALLSHCRQIHQCAKIGGEANLGKATILKVPVSESPLFDKDAGAYSLQEKVKKKIASRL